MSTGETGSDPLGGGGAEGAPSEEELRAAYEAEIKKIRVEQIVLEQVVTLVNLGMRRTGVTPGTEDERDLGQVRLAIDAIRALMPVIERIAPAQAGAIRDALSQLQLAFVRLGGSPETGETAGPGASAPPSGSEPTPPGGSGGAAPSPGPGPGPAQSPEKPGDGGPAQRSGRLWIPGQ
jgi:hypothetical protein